MAWLFIFWFGFDSDKVNFATWYLDGMKIFINLLEGLPIDILLECGAPNCNRWYIKSHKAKKFCSNKCASRANQRDIRSNPEREEEYKKIKKKQRDRYFEMRIGREPSRKNR